MSFFDGKELFDIESDDDSDNVIYHDFHIEMDIVYSQ